MYPRKPLCDVALHLLLNDLIFAALPNVDGALVVREGIADIRGVKFPVAEDDHYIPVDGFQGTLLPCYVLELYTKYVRDLL